MSQKWKVKYALTAATAAIVIIAVALIANPLLISPSTNNSTPAQTVTNQAITNQAVVNQQFLVLLTDPPTVPDGTTQLNLTYSNISLYVTYPNETSEWVPVNASGTVDLLSLVNMSQTLASTSIPVNSTVTKIQFTIASVDTVINGTAYNVTPLSNSLTVKVDNSQVNQTLSGVIVDFNPTLAQVQTIGDNGTEVDYYILVPSATAQIIDGLHQEQTKVGTRFSLDEHNENELTEIRNTFMRNVTITSASISVNGNVTSLSITLKNNGNATFGIFGLTVNGNFNATRTATSTLPLINAPNEGDFPAINLTSNIIREWFSNITDHNQSLNLPTYTPFNNEGIINASDNWNTNGFGDHNGNFAEFTQTHLQTIPFKANGTQLVPMIGIDRPNLWWANFVTLQPGETTTLTFTGTITQQFTSLFQRNPTALTPIGNDNYTIRIMGEGFQTITVPCTTP